MKAESAKLRAGKWKNYKAGMYGKPVVPAPTAPPVPIDAPPAPAPAQHWLVALLAAIFGGKK